MKNCIFCAIHAGESPAAEIYRDDQLVAFMDAFPIRPGHVLITPIGHAQHLQELSHEQREALFAKGHEISLAIRSAWPDCNGINWLLNDGRGANQSVPHVHLHLIPRRGDSFTSLVTGFAQHLIAMARGKIDHAALEAAAQPIRDALLSDHSR